VISTFNHSGTSEQWLHERVMAFELKANPKLINLAHHHSYYNDYWTQPQASVSRDFSRIMFTSNWGSTSATDVDDYMIRLSDNTFGASTAPPPSGDTTAPTVTAAESGSSGTISLSAAANDNVGVSRVEFWLDTVYKGTDSTAPYALSVDSTTLMNSGHTLVAKAYDAAGNGGSSAPVVFSVSNSSPTASDTTAPQVTASVLVSKGSITMQASASDNVGVKRVDFYVDGVAKAGDSSAPYSVGWNTSSWWPGSNHLLVAKAYDAAGNVKESAQVSFKVK
jgi:hypothetical protein